MTIKDALNKAIQILKSENIEAPAVDAGVILCHVINKDKTFLYSHNEAILGDCESERFMELIDNRAKGMPVQYIVGLQEFMSLDFYVTDGVLIPRQDTEILVETVLKHTERIDKSIINILDIGTGSGCIAVSLAYYVENGFVTAIDISEKALEIACLNAKKNNTNEKMRFLKSNLFESLNANKKYDVIVSNPPYISSAEINKLQREVRDFEPLSALDGGEDGLSFYRAISEEAKAFLEPGGLLAMEVGYNQASIVSGIMEKHYEKITLIKDLSQIDRVVMGYLNKPS